MFKFFSNLLRIYLIPIILLFTGCPFTQAQITPKKEIKFNTDEGTWISLDISPDDQRIIFELLGDIYTIPISGGKAKLLIGGNAFHSQPKYSPDGSLKSQVYSATRLIC